MGQAISNCPCIRLDSRSCKLNKTKNFFEMIEVLEKLIDKYHPLGIVKAEELLLPPKDAVNLVNELEQKGILILGVDIWYFIDNKIAEDPSSLDLSQIKDVKTSARLVKEFITNHLPERTAFVSFVLEDDRIFEGTE